MASLNEQKQLQREEETDRLQALIHSKLETAWLELDLIRRNVRLTDEESGELTLGGFFEFAANKAVETSQTREEFLLSMGEFYDQEMQAFIDEHGEFEIESDKETTGGGSAVVVVE